MWAEQSIFDTIGESKSVNYKTLVRRVSQAVRSKEDIRDKIISSNSQEQVKAVVDSIGGNQSPTRPSLEDEQACSNPFASAGRGRAVPRPGGAGRGANRMTQNRFAVPTSTGASMFAVPPLPGLSEEAKAESGAADNILQPPPPKQQSVSKIKQIPNDFSLDFLDQLGGSPDKKEPDVVPDKKDDIDFLTDFLP